MSSAFNIDQLTDTLYAESCPYSASDRRPLIGISGNYADDRLQLLPGYNRSLEAAGADVVVGPPRRHPDAHLFSLLNRLDALLLSGGADVYPRSEPTSTPSLRAKTPCPGWAISTASAMPLNSPLCAWPTTAASPSSAFVAAYRS